MAALCPSLLEAAEETQVTALLERVVLFVQGLVAQAEAEINAQTAGLAQAEAALVDMPDQVAMGAAGLMPAVDRPANQTPARPEAVHPDIITAPPHTITTAAALLGAALVYMELARREPVELLVPPPPPRTTVVEVLVLMAHQEEIMPPLQRQHLRRVLTAAVEPLAAFE